MSDETLLFRINGIKRPSKFLTATGLYLSENKRLSIPADQVHLSPTRSAEISPKNLPAQPPDMAGSLFLPPASQRQMPLRNRRRVGRPAQNRGDDADKVHAPLT